MWASMAANALPAGRPAWQKDATEGGLAGCGRVQRFADAEGTLARSRRDKNRLVSYLRAWH